MKNRTILVLLHELSLSGAPNLLLNQLTYLDANVDFVFLSNSEGLLREKYEKIGKVFVLKHNALNRSFDSRRVIIKIIYGLYIRAFSYYILKKYNPCKIISNSITNSKLVYYFRNSRIPIFTYVHEGPQLLIDAEKNGDIIRTFEYSTEVFVVSSLLKSILLEFGCKKLIRIIPGGVKIQNNILDYFDQRDEYRVLIVGRMYFNKGSDLLINFTQELVKQGVNVKITWVGVDFESIEYKILKFDIDKLGLNQFIIFIGLTNLNIDSFYIETDLVVSLSRSEAFPLVALEAASFGKVCLSFENIGGFDEIYNGIDLPKIPYLNLFILARETQYLLYNKELKEQLEASVKSKFLDMYTIEKSSRILKRFLFND